MKAILSLVIPLLFSCQTTIADSVDDLLEQARYKGKEFEKLKKVLNEEPDQNVRLATFDLIMKGADGTMKAIAIDSGLASTDKLMQSAAFKAAKMDLERIHLKLERVSEEKSELPRYLAEYLAENGYELVIPLGKKDSAAATFTYSYHMGEIAGSRITYANSKLRSNGIFRLKDDDAIEGELTMYGVQFKATAIIR